MARFVLEEDSPGSQAGRFIVEQDAPQPAASAPTGLAERLGAPQELSFGEQIAQYMPSALASTKGGVVGGILKGGAAPTVGLAQFVANVFGQGDAANKFVADKEREYQALRSVEGRSGFDAAQTLGEFISPANVILAGKLPAGSPGVLGTAATGAGLGALSGLVAPVVDDSKSYAGQKAADVILGGVVGGLAAPAIGKAGELIGRGAVAIADRIGTKRLENWRNVQGSAINQAEVETEVQKALQVAGVDPAEVAPNVLGKMREQVAQAMAQGKTVADPKALARIADYKALEMPYTLGQATRDPMQYAREKNLAGVEGVGEPLIKVFGQQNEIATNRLGSIADGAADAYNAGTQLTGALKSIDKTISGEVSRLYKVAKESSGKTLDVPTSGLVQDYARILQDFGDKVPSGVINNFNKFGFGGAKQTRIFDFEEAENLLKVINANTSNDPATNTALGQLRQSVKNAILQADDKGGVFKDARKAAADRFALHDALPALAKASKDEISADRFVQQFIIGADTNQVKNLAGVLKIGDPQAFGQARLQVGEHLRRIALGENLAGDRAFGQDAFAKELRKLGRAKLEALFPKETVDDLYTLSRAMANSRAFPADAPVNTSKSAVVAISNKLMGVLDKATGGLGSMVAGAGGQAIGAMKRTKATKAAVNPDVPLQTAKPPADRPRTLADIIRMGGVLGLGGMVVQ